jgi:hypothetical protein
VVEFFKVNCERLRMQCRNWIINNNFIEENDISYEKLNDYFHFMVILQCYEVMTPSEEAYLEWVKIKLECMEILKNVAELITTEEKEQKFVDCSIRKDLKFLNNLRAFFI